jgi:acyl-CoA synthetase (AMP-forming)/AMP-acid ligase II
MVRNAALFGEQVAIFDHGNSYTHAELLDRCWRLADKLRRRGVRRQDRVAILLGNGLDVISMFGACELFGFIAVPLNWRLSAAELADTIADCQPVALVYEARFAGLAAAIANCSAAPSIVFLTDGEGETLASLLDGPAPDGSPDQAQPDDIAYVIYTSGSSGKPKGVMLDQRNQMNSVRIMATEMRLTGADRGFISMPLFHVGARLYQSAVALSGGPAFIAGRFDPAEALEAIEKHRLTFAPMVPTMVERLIDHPDAQCRDLSSLRMILYTGAPMPGPVIRRGIQLLGPRFMQQYGQTENCGGASLYPHHHAIGGTRGEQILGSVGQPGMHASIAVVGEDMKPLGQGEVGEILISSGAQMRGYWNNSILTSETIRDGWIRTGDLGRFDHEGFLYIVGRKKDMIISGGENIFAGEVEEALAKHPTVAHVAVIGIPDEKWGESVKAFVVRSQDSAASEEELIAHCTTLIASYKRPKSIEFVRALPLNPIGKVDKKVLRALNGAPLEMESAR